MKFILGAGYSKADCSYHTFLRSKATFYLMCKMGKEIVH